MKLSTVAEALEAEVDEPVLAIRGRLVKIFRVMSGEGQYGPYTLQSGVLKDDTGEIKVNFSNREEVPQNWKNQLVELRCTKGQKGGFSGVKRSVDNRKANILQVTGSADVFLFKDEHTPEPGAAKPNGQEKGPEKPPETSAPPPKGNAAPPQQNASKVQPTTAERMADGLARLRQIANTQYAALRMVHEYLVPLLKDRGITVDAAQTATLVQNMLIQCYYEKVHWNFPETEFKPKTNGAPPPPE